MWNDVLASWENGIPFTYPSHIKNSFEWNTSVLKTGREEYKERFKINKNLPTVQNFYEFQEYIAKSKNKHVVSFPNLNGDTMLIVPMPVPGKNYATLKDFIDNAPQIQQQEFWKRVAKVAKNRMKKGNVWISVHGMGVHYTHVRISYSPKYYFD